MRGEYATSTSRKSARAELPPRARRILTQFLIEAQAHGTTSACAENTWWKRFMFWVAGNYLRVRGEYTPTHEEPWCPLELPPRARRIQKKEPRFASARGTTSACAENTPPAHHENRRGRNYLRVRGEYGFYRFHPIGIVELPPRARRIQQTNHQTRYPCRNYLRVRGEY